MGRRATKHQARPAKESRGAVEEAARGITVAEGAEILGRTLRRELVELETKKLTNTQRQNQMKRCYGMLGMLGKLTGEQLTERELLRHPRFQSALDVVIRSLEPWPEAMAAAGEALVRAGVTERTGT